MKPYAGDQVQLAESDNEVQIMAHQLTSLQLSIKWTLHHQH
jgi:hypothetical protein